MVMNFQVSNETISLIETLTVRNEKILETSLGKNSRTIFGDSTILSIEKLKILGINKHKSSEL